MALCHELIDDDRPLIVGHLEMPIEVGTGASFLLKDEDVRIIEMTTKIIFKAAWIARSLGNWATS